MKKILILIGLLFSIVVQSQTVSEVRALINSNLASGTKITAEKHREVEHSIVSLVENNAYLYKGSFTIGDPTLVDTSRVVSFPNVGTSNYVVVGSLVSHGSNFDNDNDVIFTIRNKFNTQFELLLREVTPGVQNLSFDYVLIPL